MHSYMGVISTATIFLESMYRTILWFYSTTYYVHFPTHALLLTQRITKGILLANLGEPHVISHSPKLPLQKKYHNKSVILSYTYFPGKLLLWRLFPYGCTLILERNLNNNSRSMTYELFCLCVLSPGIKDAKNGHGKKRQKEKLTSFLSFTRFTLGN